ncbi:MAG: 2-amino-4-hydroxy-6-hydroxymethyldihydropteridine diphosphokinase [Bacteroidales bacterium]|nr:2-amino-4-hydroxy-6-hydroxymethyldihydropteridine diphosphokinase [Bacteroidales bacterium]
MEENDLQKTYRGRWRNNTVVLLIGGNEGDRMSLLVRAMIEIGKRIGMVSLLSSVYETEPWGFDASQNFLNQAIVVDTDLSAEEVLTQALEIEKELGRQRNGEGYASRPMDIDLIFFNSEVMYSERLTIPHPRMDKRRFVLEPLAEIIPNFLHPKLKKTVRELLEECADTGAVKRFF